MSPDVIYVLNFALLKSTDGGATVSLDGGATWSTQMNQPTGEMYRVAVDTGYPYRVYSAQQNAGAVSVPTASRNVPVELVDVHDVGAGEASNIAVDRRNPSIVYATISGQIAKTDTARKTSELLQVYPEPRVGQRAPARPASRQSPKPKPGRRSFSDLPASIRSSVPLAANPPCAASNRSLQSATEPRLRHNDS